MNPSACLVCGGSELTPHLEILLRCQACGFVTARLDAPLDARKLYEDDYFTGQEYLDYKADEAFFKRNFRKRLREVLAHAQQQRRGGAGPGRPRLLEIGAAYGFFLDLAREHFDTVGFEVNPEAVRFAREQLKLDVRTDDVLAADAAAIGGPVDVTVMWDVIEHLDRPDRFIEHIAELSAPGALLFLTTGDIGSLAARARGRRWRMIHPPTHLHYFDRRTLPALLSRCGFEPLSVSSVGVARGIHQVLYSILALRLGRQSWYEACKKLIPANWGFTLNTFDIMQVVGRRK